MFHHSHSLITIFPQGSTIAYDLAFAWNAVPSMSSGAALFRRIWRERERKRGKRERLENKLYGEVSQHCCAQVRGAVQDQLSSVRCKASKERGKEIKADVSPRVQRGCVPVSSYTFSLIAVVGVPAKQTRSPRIQQSYSQDLLRYILGLVVAKVSETYLFGSCKTRSIPLVDLHILQKSDRPRLLEWTKRRFDQNLKMCNSRAVPVLCWGPTQGFDLYRNAPARKRLTLASHNSTGAMIDGSVA